MKSRHLLITIVLAAFTACSLQETTGTPISKLPNESCIASFDTFAYTIPDLLGSAQETILPLSPWQLEAPLPEIGDSGLIATEIARTQGLWSEVWIKKSPFTYYFADLEEPYLYLVYQQNTGKWKTVSAQVENSEAFVDRLFVDKKGAIWGRNVWASNLVNSDFPILSRYNEIDGYFEFEESTEEIPHGWLSNSSTEKYPSWSNVFLDNNGVFWIFVSQDAIYSYDPISQKVVRHAELSAYKEIGSAAFTKSGSIYFTQRLLSETLAHGRILEYFPPTNEIKIVELPEETWLDPGNILVDRFGRLWLDAYGFRDLDESWILLHPRMGEFVRKIAQQDLWTQYYPPSIFMESSDGRLWFGIGQFRNRANYRTGVAWFNPETMKGCWFTSEGTYVVEDQRLQLWMVANNNLYVYSLDK